MDGEAVPLYPSQLSVRHFRQPNQIRKKQVDSIARYSSTVLQFRISTPECRDLSPAPKWVTDPRCSWNENDVVAPENASQERLTSRRWLADQQLDQPACPSAVRELARSRFGQVLNSYVFRHPTIAGSQMQNRWQMQSSAGSQRITASTGATECTRSFSLPRSSRRLRSYLYLEGLRMFPRQCV
jgi:hypothetical protein